MDKHISTNDTFIRTKRLICTDAYFIAHFNKFVGMHFIESTVRRCIQKLKIKSYVEFRNPLSLQKNRCTLTKGGSMKAGIPHIGRKYHSWMKKVSYYIQQKYVRVRRIKMNPTIEIARPVHWNQVTNEKNIQRRRRIFYISMWWVELIVCYLL